MGLSDDRGEYIGAKTTSFKGLPQSNVEEAKGLKEAINCLGNLRFPSLSIKLDCKQIVDDISSNLNTNFMC